MRYSTLTSMAIYSIITSSSLYAEESTGNFYVALRGGIDFVQDTDLSATGNSISFTRAETELDTGWNAGAAFGYRYSSNFAAEFEYLYRSADVDYVKRNGIQITDDGDLASTAFFMNGYYFFDSDNAVTPYVGAGLGYANEVDIDLGNGAGAGASDLEADGFVFQLIGGIEYAISEHLALSGEARYFNVPSELDLSNGGNTISLDYDGFSLQVGLKYQF